MRIKDFLKKHGINIDAELIINLIMLLIPGIRIPGAIWMYSRIQRKYGLMGMKKAGLILLMVLIATGTIAEFVTDAFWPLTVAAALGSAGYLLFNKSKDRQSDLYAFLLGRDNCSLDQLMQALDMSEKQVTSGIKTLKKQGKLPSTTYIDKANRMIVLTPDGRSDFGKKDAAASSRPQTRQAQAKNSQSQQEEEAQQASNQMSKYEKILYQIRYINEQIKDEKMSEKIYHIENTTANIFHLVEQKPEKAGEIQTFMEYYLPTTMNVLYKYSLLEQHSDIESENIKQAKHNIETTMDKVVEGFDTQLDKLFKSDAIDITNDVKVLEKMMKMEGLNK
ncbi:MAG: 5-bromo-4-chloroindolyl phosphate hydrolysis family protein [Clostridia bacterium]|nr:5-bromo-4-chloroindolyl phosphate hydrolysis family protein [Clostridia bacterium]